MTLTQLIIKHYFMISFISTVCHHFSQYTEVKKQ